MSAPSGHFVVEQASYCWWPHMDDVHLPHFPLLFLLFPIPVSPSAPPCQTLPRWQSPPRVLAHLAQNVLNLAAPRHPTHSSASELMVLLKSSIFVFYLDFHFISTAHSSVLLFCAADPAQPGTHFALGSPCIFKLRFSISSFRYQLLDW